MFVYIYIYVYIYVYIYIYIYQSTRNGANPKLKSQPSGGPPNGSDIREFGIQGSSYSFTAGVPEIGSHGCFAAVRVEYLGFKIFGP